MNEFNENGNINSENESKQGENKPSLLADVFEWVQMLALYFSVAMLILSVFFTHSPVNGLSMSPTLTQNDLLIINKVAYTPSNGDIVVCQSERFGFDKPLVKRVIATEGQTVTIDYENRKITVDGVLLNEDYISKEATPFDASNYLDDTFTVPDGHVFVMGDNRGHGKSLDSRDSSIGMIDERYILGKVVLRLFPISEFKFF